MGTVNEEVDSAQFFIAEKISDWKLCAFAASIAQRCLWYALTHDGAMRITTEQIVKERQDGTNKFFPELDRILDLATADTKTLVSLLANACWMLK